jgi:glycosyltransferase involved in cell wall biosynthesis
VVLFAGQDWWNHGSAHSDFQIAKQLSGNVPVLVVNSIGMRFPIPGRTAKVGTRIWRKLRSMLRFVGRPDPAQRLWVLTPVSLPVFGVPVISQLNHHAVLIQVWAVAAALGLRRPAVIGVVPTAAPVIRWLRWRPVVYYRADHHSRADDVDTERVQRFEREMFALAERVAYSSPLLMRDEAELVGPKAVFLDHGVELEHFRPIEASAVPKPRPVIGFFGSIERLAVDIELLERIAEEFPDAELLLIGRPASDLASLTTRENVRLTGWCPYADLPSAAAVFDVALCPMPDNDWIRVANPIKLKEYLAMGLPVVSTWTADLERYSNVVHLAKGHDEFIDAIRDVLAGRALGDPASRRAAVEHEGWDTKAREMWSLLCPQD